MLEQTLFSKFSSLMQGKSLLYAGQIPVEHKSFTSHVYSVLNTYHLGPIHLRELNLHAYANTPLPADAETPPLMP